MHRAAVEERCKHWVQVPSDAKRREDLNKSVAATLSALGCTYLDLLVIEWPCHWAPGTKDADPSGDGAATWSAMEALVAAGSVKQLGVAHHGLGDVEALLDAAKSAKPVVNMLELHPLCSQRKLVGQLLRKAHPPLTPSHQPLPHPLSCTFRQCVCVLYMGLGSSSNALAMSSLYRRPGARENSACPCSSSTPPTAAVPPASAVIYWRSAVQPGSPGLGCVGSWRLASLDAEPTVMSQPSRGAVGSHNGACPPECEQEHPASHHMHPVHLHAAAPCLRCLPARLRSRCCSDCM